MAKSDAKTTKKAADKEEVAKRDESGNERAKKYGSRSI